MVLARRQLPHTLLIAAVLAAGPAAARPAAQPTVETQVAQKHYELGDKLYTNGDAPNRDTVKARIKDLQQRIAARRHSGLQGRARPGGLPRYPGGDPGHHVRSDRLRRLPQ